MLIFLIICISLSFCRLLLKEKVQTQINLTSISLKTIYINILKTLIPIKIQNGIH